MADKVAEIRRWHVQERKWKDIGYHYLIDRNGVLALGRPVEQVGAHVQGHNTGTIGICLIGGHGSAETDKFSDNFTATQDTVLRVLLNDLKRQHPGIVKISGHNQYAAKACPGFNVPQWYQPITPTPIKPDNGHKPISPGMTANPNQPKHWLTHVLNALANFLDFFGGKK